MRQHITIILLCTLLASLTSCRILNSSTMFSTGKDFRYLDPPKTASHNTIQPNDVLHITMQTNKGYNLLEANINSNANNRMSNYQQISYLVEKDSLVKLPTLGRIKIGGLTIREAEDMLEKKFSDDYKDPFVQIRITNKKVFIFLNQATRASTINLPQEDMSLIEALSNIGGLSKYSKSYKIRLLRGSQDNVQIYNYNFYSLESFKSANLTLQANDILYIETRARYIGKVVEEIQPYMILLSTGLLAYNTFQKYFP